MRIRKRRAEAEVAQVIGEDTGDQVRLGEPFETERMRLKADYQISNEPVEIEFGLPIITKLYDGNKTFRVFDLRVAGDFHDKPKEFENIPYSSGTTVFMILDETFEPKDVRPSGYKAISYGATTAIGKETENGRRFYQSSNPDSLFSVTHSSFEDILVISAEHGKVGLIAAEEPIVIQDPTYEEYINMQTSRLKDNLTRKAGSPHHGVNGDLADMIIDRFADINTDARSTWIDLLQTYNHNQPEVGS